MIRQSLAAVGVAAFAALVAGCTVTPAYVDKASSADYSSLEGFGATAEQLDTEYDLPADVNGWERTRNEICADPNSDQYSFPGTMADLPEDEKVPVGNRIWAAALVHSCPEALDDWEWPVESLIALTAESPSWANRTESAPASNPSTDAPNDDERAAICNDGTVIYSTQAENACTQNGGLLHASQITERELRDLSGGGSSSYSDPNWEMGVDGNGYAVTCADGQISLSGGNSGACSGHGGIG